MLNQLYSALLLVTLGLSTGAFGENQGAPFIAMAILGCLFLATLFGIKYRSFGR